MEQVQRHQLDKSNSEISLQNGYWFYCDDGDRRIAVHGCGYSGKETVYINDEQVLQKRNFGLKSNHTFEFEGDSYQVCFNVKSIFRGSLICTIHKNGRLLLNETQAYLGDSVSVKTVAKDILRWMIYGFAFGAAVGTIVAFLGDK